MSGQDKKLNRLKGVRTVQDRTLLKAGELEERKPEKETVESVPAEKPDVPKRRPAEKITSSTGKTRYRSGDVLMGTTLGVNEAALDKVDEIAKKLNLSRIKVLETLIKYDLPGAVKNQPVAKNPMQELMFMNSTVKKKKFSVSHEFRKRFKERFAADSDFVIAVEELYKEFKKNQE